MNDGGGECQGASSVIPAAAAQSIEFPLSLSRWGEVLFALVD